MLKVKKVFLYGSFNSLPLDTNKLNYIISTQMNTHVSIWKEEIRIPTYAVGKPDKNPMFLEKRVYQGSSGVVYPHPVIDKIMDEKKEQPYTAVYLENEFVKIMILPQLGGRIQMAYDKVKQRHFVYYNQVIKPALVGLTGPWISGGIEFNWPQHHRPGTFEPVDYQLVNNEDGSVTCWVNEVELMFRTKGMAGFTLYPGKAYLEIKGKLYNRTPFPQTFLWWANPAVKVNDDYQSIFPPDVHAVFDHGKRDVSAFPIAKGTYYKVDYSPGTDISRYRNIPVPTSYMAVTSKYNFIGGYEHDTGGGLLHVADHHISPGKKQWTWGHGEFGKAWDKNLTDEDGPYIELMTGVFTDNQPDFSWIQPYEVKEFVQYFMPYREVGQVKNATRDAAVGIEIVEGNAILKVHFTGIYNNIEIKVSTGQKILFSQSTEGSPEKPFIAHFPINETIFLLEVIDKITGKRLVTFLNEPLQEKELPLPAMEAKKPADVINNEQLFLTGHHIEQYRHATYSPLDYYEEALRRDAGDIRCNNAMGLWYIRKARPAIAEEYLKKAIATATFRNPNPYDGECYYNLGWSLLFQHKTDEAYDAFYKATWNDAWQHAAFLNLARIDCRREDWEAALQSVEKSLNRNMNSHTARHLKAVILKKMGLSNEAWINLSLQEDPFNYGCLFEKKEINDLLTLSRNWFHNMLEYALDYTHAGFFEEAEELLLLHLSHTTSPSPLCFYYLSWIAGNRDNTPVALEYAAKGHALSHEYCFPHRIEDVIVLEYVLQIKPHPKCRYYLGNLWYDKKQYDLAIECWNTAISEGADFATVYRNLALAMYNKKGRKDNALTLMDQAFSLDNTDARVLMELDQLHKNLNTAPAARLAFLEKHTALLTVRDDLYLEYITLLNQSGAYEKAAQMLASKQFHPWEGGEGKVTGQHQLTYLQLAKASLQQHNPQTALEQLAIAENYPDNLGEGKLPGAQENDIFYLKGIACAQAGDTKNAEYWFNKATIGISEPVQAIFYNDAQPDKILYQGLAWFKLGQSKTAADIFNRLIAFGEQHLHDKIEIDYFAVSLPDLLVFDADLNMKNRMHCMYMIGLGYLGYASTGKIEYAAKAAEMFSSVMQQDINHLGAIAHMELLNSRIG